MGPRRLRTVSFGSSRNKQAIRSNRARALRCKGANASLVEMGFSETSLNRLSCEAVCSQEAMKHHDSSEKDLVAATLNSRLARPFRSQPEVPKDVAQALMTGWTKFVNPSAYRALLEMLHRCANRYLNQDGYRLRAARPGSSACCAYAINVKRSVVMTTRQLYCSRSTAVLCEDFRFKSIMVMTKA